MENSLISVLHSRGKILHEVGFLSASLVTGGVDLKRKFLCLGVHSWQEH